MNGEHVRWVIRRDVPGVLAIDAEAFPQNPFTAETLVGLLGRRNIIGYVAEVSDRVIGYMILGYFEHRIEVVSIAVWRAVRRLRVGEGLMRKAIGKLKYRKDGAGRVVFARVRERDLQAQLFFAALGFKAVRNERDYYGDAEAGTAEDAIEFEYRDELRRG